MLPVIQICTHDDRETGFAITMTAAPGARVVYAMYSMPISWYFALDQGLAQTL
jgi:hypothetical protein